MSPSLALEDPLKRTVMSHAPALSTKVWEAPLESDNSDPSERTTLVPRVNLGKIELIFHIFWGLLVNEIIAGAKERPGAALHGF